MKELLTIGPIKQITIVLKSRYYTAQCSHSGAQNAEINVIGQQTIWQPFSAAIISQNESGLEILVVTNHTHKLWNRAYLPIRISSSNANSVHSRCSIGQNPT